MCTRNTATVRAGVEPNLLLGEVLRLLRAGGGPRGAEEEENGIWVRGGCLPRGRTVRRTSKICSVFTTKPPRLFSPPDREDAIQAHPES